MTKSLLPKHMLKALALFLTLAVLLAACGDSASESDGNSNETGAQPAATSDPTSDDSASMPEPTATSESATDTPAPEAAPENPAPELGSIDSWHNSEPLTLAELRGSPVLLVFWADY